METADLNEIIDQGLTLTEKDEKRYEEELKESKKLVDYAMSFI
jgi:hypothetical protein